MTETPVRQLGRVDEELWDAIKEAPESASKTLTVWAVRALIREAIRTLRRKGNPKNSDKAIAVLEQKKNWTPKERFQR